MIEFENLHHISLNVTDLERAKTFYRDVLCLREIERPNFDFPGAWFAIGDSQLHLIVDPASQTIRKKKDIATREGHFAIRVSNYEQTRDWLAKQNVEYFENTKSKSGFQQIFLTDPDGNIIELHVETKAKGHV